MEKTRVRRNRPAVVPRLAELIGNLPKYEKGALLWLKHEWKLRSLSRSLAKALGDSWEASSWPGDRLAVGVEMSEKVERLTRLLNRETRVHNRLVAHLR